MLLNSQQIAGKIKKEILKYLETNENVNTMIQNLWDTAKTVLKETYSLPQETRKISNKQLNLTPKGTRKENKEQPKPKINKNERI